VKPAAQTPEALVIGPVTDVAHDAAFAFHRANLGDFILPLGPSTFQQIVEARQVVAIEHRGEVAGLCYVKPDGKELDDDARWEFGGLYLAPDLRGLGLGTVLSAVAIAAATAADRKPVMGYVHQANLDGLALLVHRLGFIVTDQTIRLGPDDAAGYLRRDSAGFATAKVLHLPDAAIVRIAADVERVASGARTHAMQFPVRLAGGLFPSRAHGC